MFTGRQGTHKATSTCPHWVSQSHESRRKGRVRTLPWFGPKTSPKHPRASEKGCA